MARNILDIEDLWDRHDVWDRLYKRYKKEIHDSFYPHLIDWKVIEDEHGKYLQDFLGSVMSIMPSGKFYMPWTTNQTQRDVIKDSAFMSALEDVLDEYDMWIESGEGDPTDLFVCARLIEQSIEPDFDFDEEEENDGDSE